VPSKRKLKTGPGSGSPPSGAFWISRDVTLVSRVKEAKLWGDLKDDAVTPRPRAAELGRTKEITGLVENQVVMRPQGGLALEDVEHPERPAPIRVRRKPEGRAATSIAAKVRRAVKIPGRVENEASKGSGCWMVREAMDHALRPGSIRVRRQPEDRAAAVAAGRIAANCRRAVKIPGRVENEAGKGIGSVRAGEAMEHALGPSSVRVSPQFEDDTAAARTGTPRDTTIEGRAVEIPGRVEDKAGVGMFPVGSGEAMQHALRPGSIQVRR